METTTLTPKQIIISNVISEAVQAAVEAGQADCTKIQFANDYSTQQYVRQALDNFRSKEFQAEQLLTVALDEWGTAKKVREALRATRRRAEYIAWQKGTQPEHYYEMTETEINEFYAWLGIERVS